VFFVYVLKSLKDGKRYIGFTINVERRLEEHNRGKSKSVKNRGPFEIIYKEQCKTRAAAIQKEKQLKRFKGGEALKNLLEKDISDPIV
jgi:putative endonuclease